MKMGAVMKHEPSIYQLACRMHDAHTVPVFPVRISKDEHGKWHKQPLVRWGSIPGDPRDVVWHGANAVGVPMGRRSGLITIDLDDYKDGSEAELWLKGHDLPPTRVHGTTSGGRHLIFRMPDGCDLGNHAPDVTGLDIRGNGGFIVWADVPGRYSVLEDRPPSELPVPVCQELQALKTVSRTETISDAEVPDFGYVDPRAVEMKLQKLLQHPDSQALRRRFEGDVAGLKDTSASARDMSVASLLARSGFSFDEIVQVLLEHYPHGTAVRDGWNERTERGARRCAFRADQQAHKEFEASQAAMRKHLLNRRQHNRQRNSTHKENEQ